jgi:hypothetical protein
VDSAHLRSLVVVERRKEPGCRACEKRLADAGRADERDVVASRDRDLERPTRDTLPDHARQVGRVLRQRLHRRRQRRAEYVERFHAGEVPRHVGEVARRPHHHPPHRRALRAVLVRDDGVGRPARQRRRHQGERARHRPEAAVEGKLSDERRRPQARRVELARGDEDRGGDREVVAGPLLRQVRRREVDGDPAGGDLETRVPKRAPDPLARLLHGAAGEPHDRQAREPERDIDLDADGNAVDTDHGGAEGGRDHGGASSGGACVGRGKCRSPACSPP